MVDYERDYLCPLCRGRLSTRLDCPGFGSNPVMVCSGEWSCGSELVVSCNDCDYECFPEGTTRSGFSDRPPVSSARRW